MTYAKILELNTIHVDNASTAYIPVPSEHLCGALEAVAFPRFYGLDYVETGIVHTYLGSTLNGVFSSPVRLPQNEDSPYVAAIEGLSDLSLVVGFSGSTSDISFDVGLVIWLKY